MDDYVKCLTTYYVYLFIIYVGIKIWEAEIVITYEIGI